MKKLIIASFVAALFAACNNAPAVTESATNLTKLNAWVDSMKTVIAAAPAHDSATLASYTEAFNTAVASIKMEELDEAGKATLATATESWNAVGVDFKAKMDAEKAAAMAADTTAAVVAPVEEGKNIIEKGKEVVKDAKEMIKK